jgi:hypothetical protein
VDVAAALALTPLHQRSARRDENCGGSTPTRNTPPYESERQYREVKPGHERLVHRERIDIVQKHAGSAGAARCRPHGKPVQEHFTNPIGVRDEGRYGAKGDVSIRTLGVDHKLLLGSDRQQVKRVGGYAPGIAAAVESLVVRRVSRRKVNQRRQTRLLYVG